MYRDIEYELDRFLSFHQYRIFVDCLLDLPVCEFNLSIG